MHGPLRIRARFCLYLSGSHGRWWCHDGIASRGGFGIGSTKWANLLAWQSTDKLTRFLALQGAARMVLQGGTHPAQLKDSVTSKRGYPCAPYVYFSTIASPGWMHHCRIIGIRRWKGSFNDCKRHSSCNRASQRAWTTDDEVNAVVQRATASIKLSVEKCTTWSVYLFHGTYISSSWILSWVTEFPIWWSASPGLKSLHPFHVYRPNQMSCPKGGRLLTSIVDHLSLMQMLGLDVDVHILIYNFGRFEREQRSPGECTMHFDWSYQWLIDY